MEIYKDINSNETKEFANLLNNQTKSNPDCIFSALNGSVAASLLFY